MPQALAQTWSEDTSEQLITSGGQECLPVAKRDNEIERTECLGSLPLRNAHWSRKSTVLDDITKSDTTSAVEAWKNSSLCGSRTHDLCKKPTWKSSYDNTDSYTAPGVVLMIARIPNTFIHPWIRSSNVRISYTNSLQELGNLTIIFQCASLLNPRRGGENWRDWIQTVTMTTRNWKNWQTIILPL